VVRSPPADPMGWMWRWGRSGVGEAGASSHPRPPAATNFSSLTESWHSTNAILETKKLIRIWLEYIDVCGDAWRS